MTSKKKAPAVAAAGASGDIVGAKTPDHNRTEQAPQATGWRRDIEIYPAALIFPRPTAEELRTLADDIAANGLKSPIVIWTSRAGKSYLLDGISRLDAMERVGFAAHLRRVALGDGTQRWMLDVAGLDFNAQPSVELTEHVVPDPFLYVISANIHRRHLTKAEQATLIVAAMKMRDDLAKPAGEPANVAEVPPAIDPAKMARSIGGARGGRKGGSTKDPVKEAAIAEGAKHGISGRTVERALAAANPKPPTKRARRAKPTTVDPSVEAPVEIEVPSDDPTLLDRLTKAAPAEQRACAMWVLHSDLLTLGDLNAEVRARRAALTERATAERATVTEAVKPQPAPASPVDEFPDLPPCLDRRHKRATLDIEKAVAEPNAMEEPNLMPEQRALLDATNELIGPIEKLRAEQHEGGLTYVLYRRERNGSETRLSEHDSLEDFANDQGVARLQ